MHVPLGSSSSGTGTTLMLNKKSGLIESSCYCSELVTSGGKSEQQVPLSILCGTPLHPMANTYTLYQLTGQNVLYLTA